MLTDERHRAILRLIAENGRVTMAEIAERFEVSVATARRDAVGLAEAGKAARSHGGLLPAKFFQREPHFRVKAARHMGLKARLARKAVTLLPHEGNVFVDAGTTCLEVGRLLLDRSGKPSLLEVNTSPGMTGHSLVPMAARQIGIAYEDLCVKVLEGAHVG